MKYKQLNGFYFVHKKKQIDTDTILMRILYYNNDVVFSFYTECDDSASAVYWNVFEKNLIDFLNNKTTTNVSKINYEVYNCRLVIFYEQVIFIYLDNGIPEKYKSYFDCK